MELEINSLRYSVVVLGAMNPAIHHPQWYEAVGMLSAAEAQEAMRGGALAVAPQLAQFQFAGFQIQCLPGRWQIEAAGSQQRNRVIDLAALTFQRLGETPINAYGLNARFDVSTGAKNAFGGLTTQFTEEPLDLSFDGIPPDFESLEVSYTLPTIKLEGQPDVERRLKATIGRAPHRPDAVVVNFNAHHEIIMRTEFAHFDLDRLLRASADVFETEDTLLKHIVSALIDLKR